MNLLKNFCQHNLQWFMPSIIVLKGPVFMSGIIFELPLKESKPVQCSLFRSTIIKNHQPVSCLPVFFMCPAELLLLGFRSRTYGTLQGSVIIFSMFPAAFAMVQRTQRKYIAAPLSLCDRCGKSYGLQFRINFS